MKVYKKRHPALKKRKTVFIMMAGLIVITTVTLAFMYRDTWYGDLPILIAPTGQQSSNEPTITPTATPEKIQPTPSIEPTTAIWPVELTYTQAASVTAVVNKKHRLPADYVPDDLVSIDGGYLKTLAANAMQRLIDDASINGFNLTLISDYRSYSEQEAVYYGYVNRDGQALADTYSARPGFSEHQTGLAADVATTDGSCSLMTCFGNTLAGQWIASNAQNYGFIIRYPNGKDAITGYQYEPWHLRYIGIALAKDVVNSGLTLDEYFGITAGSY